MHAASNAQKNHNRTPSGRNFSLDPSLMQAVSQTNVNKTSMTPRDQSYGQKRQFSQPNMPFKFQQLMVKNKERLRQCESNLANVQSQVISPRNFHQSSLLERDPLPFNENVMSDHSPRAHSTLLDLNLNVKSQESSRMRLEQLAANKSRITSATGTSLPQITSPKGRYKPQRHDGSALSSFTMSKAAIHEDETQDESVAQSKKNMPLQIVVDGFTKSGKQKTSKPDLKSVKNQIIQQISEHKQRQLHKDRHAVRDISLLAKISRQTNQEMKMHGEKFRKQCERFVGEGLYNSD